MARSVLCLLITSLLAAAQPPEVPVPTQLVYVSGYDPSISWFALGADGGLTPRGSVRAGTKPSFLAWSPDRRCCYAVDELEQGGVISLRVGVDGALTVIGPAASSGGGIPAHVAVHPSGRWVYAANYRTGHVAVLPVGADGHAGEPIQVLLAGIKAHMAMPSADGRFLVVPCLGSDHLAVYRIDQTSGQLTLHATVPMPAGHGPRHIAFHPKLPLAYVINELASTLTTLAWDAAAGTLTPGATIPLLPAGFTAKSTTAHVLVSADGRFLYGSNRGHDSLAVCQLDERGTASVIAHETGGGDLKVPRNFSFAPGEGLLLAASQGAARVTVFRRDPASGLLSRLGSVAVADKPSFVGVMALP